MSRTQQQRFRAHLLDGRNVQCVAVEQDDTGGLWSWTTQGERIPAASIRRLEHQAPEPTTPTAEALDAFLADLPHTTVSLDEFRARRTTPVVIR